VFVELHLFLKALVSPKNEKKFKLKSKYYLELPWINYLGRLSQG